MEKDMTVWALHGFLGQDSDWEIFRKALKARGATLNAVDLYSEDFLSSEGFWDWAEKFNRRVAKKRGSHYLLGYSMGGRLALHALLENPQQWKGAIIVSAHPGLSDEEEKRQRARRDLVWAERFLSEPWDEVLHDWNAQPVFTGAAADLPRHEKDFSRQKLARMMKLWSLARQEDLSGRLQDLKMPLLWVVGQADSKFRDLAKAAQGENESVQVAVVDESGHRVPWDQTDRFLHLLEGMIS